MKGLLASMHVHLKVHHWVPQASRLISGVSEKIQVQSPLPPYVFPNYILYQIHISFHLEGSSNVIQSQWCKTYRIMHSGLGQCCLSGGH